MTEHAPIRVCGFDHSAAAMDHFRMTNREVCRWIAVVWILLGATLQGAVYLGSWRNTTFGTTGGLRIELNRSETTVAVKLDLNGNVFGSVDPPPIAFSAPLNKLGGGTFKVAGTALGDLSGSFTPAGKLSLSITNIRGGLLSAFRLTGGFDLVRETFSGSYVIHTTTGPYAHGTAAARVRKPPVISMPSVVSFHGTTAEVTARVTSNSRILKVTATSPDGAVVTASGTTTVRITASRMLKTRNRVMLSVTNADQRTATRTVTFVKSPTGHEKLLENDHNLTIVTP